ISPVAFLVDRCENVYVSGWGGNKEYPLAGTRGLSVVNNLKTSTDNKDFYFFVLKRDAASQLYGDFFGQNGGYPDHVDGGTSRFDANGVIYMAMCADCMDNESGSFRDRFPTTFGAWSYDKPASANCNLAMVKIALDLAGVAGNVRSSINGTPRDTAGCVPLTVQFSDTIRSAVSYEWNFGDGSPTITTTSPDTAHTYTRVGLYRVMLVAIDSTSCNIRDTSYLNIRVGDLRANLDFTYRKEDPCDAFRFSFTNRSTTRPERPFTDTSFIWDFGDGNRQVGGLGTVFHNYAGPGTYIVRLFLNDTGYCNFPDVLADTLYVATNVIARFDAPVVACAPSDVAFNNTSVGGQTYRWDFGDGGSSTERSPVHRYTAPGRYTVRLQVEDLNTCNRVDDTTIVLQVYGKPDAEFTVAPQPPQVNQPVLFTPQVSSDVTRLKWLFGDGDSLVTVAPSVVPYEYNNTGTYTACLIVYNPAGCTDTVCHPVQMLIDPLVDVPNAFTPNSSDGNNKVFVRGFGIAKMKFTIYSRWGEKVFETDSKRIGWDGRYKGKLMPMDVYAYTLDVEFGDGTRTRKTGDITLIR
ncbi:MAG TPA: PKD domain-containing protein, partial [Chitinophagaceae bacterium]|nr:PKD domain-containing protein [Chitinophagaceae bacterium]